MESPSSEGSASDGDRASTPPLPRRMVEGESADYHAAIEPKRGTAAYDLRKINGLKPGSRERSVVPEEQQQWRHGEILFEETNTVTKFLVVPDHVSDPNEVLRVMLGDWGLPIPNMTISVHSKTGDPMVPVETEASRKELDKWRHAKHWETFPPALFGENQPAAAQKFSSRVEDMMYGICCAAAESTGWIVSGEGLRAGGDWCGYLADVGVRKFCQTRQGDAADLVNLALCAKQWVVGGDVVVDGVECPSEFKSLREAAALYLTEENAVPLDKRPAKRLVYPKLTLHDLFYEPSNNILRSRASHIVFHPGPGGKQENGLARALKILTEDIVPHVAVFVSGKHEGTWSLACEKAQRGAQVILLKNSGKILNTMCDAVEAKREQQKLDSGPSASLSAADDAAEKRRLPVEIGGRGRRLSKEEKGQTLTWPESVSSANFLIFNVLKDTPEKVIEKLTSALAVVGGDEMREMGFAQTEKERLKYAWELCVQYRYNAEQLQHKARQLHVLVTTTAFMTTLCAVLLTASHEQRPPGVHGAEEEEQRSSSSPAQQGEVLQFEEFLAIPAPAQSVLSLACAIVPMLSAFLLALASKFAYSKRWAMMVVAGERVCSEIYLYRARVGDYQQRNKNAKLAALVAEPSGLSGSGDDSACDPRKKTQKQGAVAVAAPVLTSREVFHENLKDLQTELMASEVKMASMQRPPKSAFKKLLYDKLYPFERDDDEKNNDDMKKKKQKARAAAAVAADGGPDYEEVRALARNSLLLEDGLSDFSMLGTDLTDGGVVIDDGIRLISAEDYLKFRMLPAITRLNEAIPIYESRYNWAQGIILFTTMLASICGVIGLHVWIPAVAALVASVESLLHFDQTSARLTGANAALTQLKNLKLWWQSLSRTQQSLPQNKAQLVQSSEDAIESDTGAWTAGLLRKKHKVDADEGVEDGKDGGGGGGGGGNTQKN